MSDQDTQIILSSDQQNAMDAFFKFFLNPAEQVFVLSGYAGCGKSTLVKELLATLPKFAKAAKLIDPTFKEMLVELTATTNKAAENLSQITEYPVRTIHSLLSLRVNTDFKTGKTTLVRSRNNDVVTDRMIIIDEASYIDPTLLQYIFEGVSKCKIVFIGDPAQLTQVGCNFAPVFTAGFGGASLTNVMRQAADNPIIQVCTLFRDFVNTGNLIPFTPDGQYIQVLDRQIFNDMAEAEFSRSDWKYSDSKILGWTNKCVIGYNHYIREKVKGNPKFQVNDYVINNSFVRGSGKGNSLKTDQLVHITGIRKDTKHGLMGTFYQLDYCSEYFCPDDWVEANKALAKARKEDNWQVMDDITNCFVDLRAAYACTINKSQGSTYDKVFIDLEDIGRCRSQDQLARMLYVGFSRARTNVYLTGDLV